MQLVCAAYLLVLTAGSLLVDFVLGGDPSARLRASYLQSGVAPDQAQSLATTMSGVLLGAGVVFAIVYLVLAYASYRGWGWAYWLVGIVLLLGSFNAFSNLRNLSGGDAAMPLAGSLLSEAMSVVALAILCWFVVGLFRFGFASWARPRIARPEAAA
jgi:hypothetical protein